MILNTGFVPVTQIYALSLELQNQVKLTFPRYLIDIALYLTDSTLTWSKRICDSLPFLTLESFVWRIRCNPEDVRRESDFSAPAF